MATIGSGDFIYEMMDDWAKLPEWWTIGQAEPACDSQDRVYIFNRSDHPLMVFDREGNFLQEWGREYLTDAHGIPAPKIDYTVSDNTWAMLDHGIARATEALEAAGAKRVVSSRLRRNAGWHLLGTARMGTDPDRSVVDRWGRAHDVPNLYIIDGSIFTTGACINPTTTIQALALRTADYLKGEGSSAIS